MIEHVETGYYIFGCLGGNVNRSTSKIVAQCARRIAGGKLREWVGALSIEFPTKQGLTLIRDVSDDSPTWVEGAWCLKQGFPLVPVAYAAPHVLLSKVSVADYSPVS
jgi:predicted Zn-dependent protease